MILAADEQYGSARLGMDLMPEILADERTRRPFAQLMKLDAILLGLAHLYRDALDRTGRAGWWSVGLTVWCPTPPVLRISAGPPACSTPTPMSMPAGSTSSTSRSRLWSCRERPTGKRCCAG